MNEANVTYPSCNCSPENLKLLAHPPEPGYPCYVSVLGELAWVAPREEPQSV